MENVQFLIVHVTKIGLYVKIVVLWCASQSRKESPYEAFSRRQTQPMTAILSSRKDLYCYYRGVYADAVRNLLTIFPSLSPFYSVYGLERYAFATIPTFFTFFFL